MSAFVNHKSDAAVVKRPIVDSSKMWFYQTDIDKMTSKPNYTAIISSTNKLEFEAPYDGGTTASLDIGSNNRGSDVLLIIDKGQFLCDGTDGCTVKVRFDSNPAMEFKSHAPGDGSVRYLFIEPSKKFIAQLKKATTMIIQAEFYQGGLREMEFNVAGLKWDH